MEYMNFKSKLSLARDRKDYQTEHFHNKALVKGNNNSKYNKESFLFSFDISLDIMRSLLMLAMKPS